MEQLEPFRYRPSCSAGHCDQPAVYKIAATWSDGSSRELKNYGLTCEAHRVCRLEAARRHHQGLRLSDLETVGPVEVYVLRFGCRDAELIPYADQNGGGARRAAGEPDEAP
jgi:hypothetical protein